MCVMCRSLWLDLYPGKSSEVVQRSWLVPVCDVSGADGEQVGTYCTVKVDSTQPCCNIVRCKHVHAGSGATCYMEKEEQARQHPGTPKKSKQGDCKKQCSSRDAKPDHGKPT